MIVDPPHRRRGVGRALYDRLEREAIRRNATTLWASVNADVEADVRFARSRGFPEIRRQRQSRVVPAESRTDLLADHVAELRATGVELTTLVAEGADREEVRRECFRLHNASEKGMPGVGPRTSPTYEEFVQLEPSGPGYFPEGIHLAKLGPEYVSMTVLHREETRPDVLIVGWTGTDPRYRGRGIATALKRRSIEFARDAGFTAVETRNDYRNTKTWTINELVGFRTIHTWSSCEKSLPATP